MTYLILLISGSLSRYVSRRGRRRLISRTNRSRSLAIKKYNVRYILLFRSLTHFKKTTVKQKRYLSIRKRPYALTITRNTTTMSGVVKLLILRINNVYRLFRRKWKKRKSKSPLIDISMALLVALELRVTLINYVEILILLFNITRKFRITRRRTRLIKTLVNHI